MNKIFNKFLICVALFFITIQLFAQNVTGAGASFPAPIYAEWANSYSKQTGKRVNYQSIGSRAGVKQIIAKTVDFGATDNPLSQKELDKYNMLQFPSVIGGIVPIVNITGVPSGKLRLSGPLLAKIYLGEITKWNDEEIKKLNPNINLPDARISLVYRSDGSGTTYVFTSYLAKVSQKWKKDIGVANVVKWPTKGVAGKGNEGVAAFVSRVRNSIGYVEYSYAKQSRLSVVSLQNSSGNFISPNEKSFQAAVTEIDWAKTFVQDTTNTKSKNGWPITTATYILIPKESTNVEKTKSVLNFFDWAFSKGDASALKLDYAVFPDNVKKIIRGSWKNIKNKNGQSIKY